MDKAEFWTTKPRVAEYHAIVFDHPAFDAPFRLVANVFDEVTLGGHVHTPAPMTIKPPEQKSDSQPKLTLAFPRQVVGRQFKQQLKLVAASSSRSPITINYSIYTGDVSSPAASWDLYASDSGGIAFSDDAVQVTATDDNPMRRNVAPVYDPSVFTGLESV